MLDRPEAISELFNLTPPTIVTLLGYNPQFPLFDMIDEAVGKKRLSATSN
jgi:hypothetical protein